MTLMIILGGIAALYLIGLLFRLASLALPVCLGLCAFHLLRDQGYPPIAMLPSSQWR